MTVAEGRAAADPALGPPAGSWIEQKISLRYRIGELTLFKKSFRLSKRLAHFTELPEELAAGARPLAGLSRGVQGVLIRSHPVKGRLGRLVFEDGALRYIPARYRRSFVRIEGSFEEYLATFSSKSRSTLRRKVKKLGEATGGAVRWKEYRTPGEMRDFHRLAVEVSKKTYQERLLDSGLPADEAFRAQLESEASRGEVRGYLLFDGEAPIAYICAPIVRGSVMIYHYVGFDPAAGELSPGTVLQYLVLEKLFAEGVIRMFDFTEGEGAHKAFFATGSVDCADVYWFRRTPAALFFVPLHAAVDSVSKWMGRLFELLRLKRRLKKLLRRAA